MFINSLKDIRMKTAKGVIFDFNGTLFFDTKFHTKAFNEMLEEAGKPVYDDHFLIKNVLGKPNSTLYKEFFDPNADSAAILSFANSKEDNYIAYYLEHPEFMHLAEGAPEMLDYLKNNNIPYALATGSDLRNVEFYLSELGISKWFNFGNITYADTIIKGKPEPDIYITSAKKMGIDPSECIVFEDAVSGFKAANAAGVLAVIAVREEDLPSTIDDTVSVDLEILNYLSYKEVFAKYGLLK